MAPNGAIAASGRPQQTTPLGSFTEWSRWVRDGLIWLGEADPCAAMDAVRDADPKLEALTMVIEQWHEVLGWRRVSVKEIIDAAVAQRTTGAFSRGEFIHPDFREALLVVAGDGGAISGRRAYSTEVGHRFQRKPAAEVEDAAVAQVRHLLRTPEVIARTWAAAKSEVEVPEREVVETVTDFAPLWDELFPAEQARIVRLLVERVDLSPDGMKVRLRIDGLQTLVAELRTRAAA